MSGASAGGGREGSRAQKRPHRLKYWWYRKRGYFLYFGGLAIMLSLVGYGFGSTERESRIAKETFMEECLTERKQYECTAMWRSGEGWFKD